MQGKVEICGVNTSKLKVLKNEETMELLRRTLAEDFSPACPRLLLEENPRRILEDRPLVGTDEPIFSPREDEL